jgi:DNA-binding NarL/FixJ family response regulator
MQFDYLCEAEVKSSLPPRVVIAEDHQLVLDGIRRIVEGECEVIGTATNGRQAILSAAELRPDLVLLDIALPGLNGIDAARQIKRAFPDIRIIFVTVQLNRDYVREAFEAGASGYVSKQAAATELVAAIREVHQGRFFLSPLVTERFLGPKAVADQNPLKLFASLTPRQREVLQLVAEGKSAKEIGETLTISVKTVEFHKKHLMEELNLRTSAELIRYALEQELVRQ